MIDIHDFARQYVLAQQRLAASSISQRNKNLIRSYVTAVRIGGIAGNVRIIRMIDVLRDLAQVLPCDLDAVTRTDLEEVLSVILARPYAPATIGTIKAIIRRFYTWLADPTHFTRSSPAPALVAWLRVPSRDRRNVCRTDLLTLEDVTRVLEYCERSRDRALIALLWETGGRISEIGNLQRSDVHDHPHGYLVTVRGKTGVRTLLVVRSAPLLRVWLRRHPIPEAHAPVWVHPRREAVLQYATLNKIVRVQFARAGVQKRLYPHLFRHSRVTHLLSAGLMNEAQVKSYFGWTRNSMMLATYSHLIDRDTDAAILRENNIVPDP